MRNRATLSDVGPFVRCRSSFAVARNSSATIRNPLASDSESSFPLTSCASVSGTMLKNIRIRAAKSVEIGGFGGFGGLEGLFGSLRSFQGMFKHTPHAHRH